MVIKYGSCSLGLCPGQGWGGGITAYETTSPHHWELKHHIFEEELANVQGGFMFSLLVSVRIALCDISLVLGRSESVYGTH